MSTIPENEMPAPRLEMRWVDVEPKAEDGFDWTVECVYSLVLRLGEYDIRRERYDADGNELPKLDTKTIEIGRTRSTNYLKRWGQDKIDTPFRDHSHAKWDTEQLGNLPVYAVAAGRAMLVEFKPKEGE